MTAARCMLLGLAAAALVSCGENARVPIVDINARFTLADTAWFEEEQTLFFFWRLEAEQGLGAESQMELMWRTDDAEQPWAPIKDLPAVHTHLAVDCGRTARCGSTSLHVVGEPRQVGLRLRYHSKGAMVLDPPVTQLNVVRTGPPHSNRSLVVYGVFDEQNRMVQWRGRHQFPTLRNPDVEGLGLRRWFQVADPAHGALGVPLDNNPYGYGVVGDCSGLTALGRSPLETSDRAIFDPEVLPLTASTSPVLCGRSTVTDATGAFEAVAIAQKNPEVRPAFPFLSSPVTENTQIGFVLRPCARTISQEHLSMQMQRLLLSGAPEICIDAWSQAGFADQLAARFKSAVDTVRPQGNDMVLLVALHHDDNSGQLAAVLENALMQVLPAERDKSSPRLSGAFVFDSRGQSMGTAELRRMVLWCPANVLVDDLDQIPANSEMSCPVQPDLPDLVLGPVKVGNLPILPTRPQYLKFIEKYSDAQAGRMKKLTFRAPGLTPVSENIPVGDFGVVTFFNNELITPEADDAFSYCGPDDGTIDPAVFRVALSPEPAPLALLPQLHDLAPQPSYSLGLFWDFPYLLRLEYEVVIAGAASAYGFTVPFGVGTQNEGKWGTQLTLWESGGLDLSQRLLQCTQFCTHPTFDSAGVYNVTALFKTTYQQQCYRPVYPKYGDGGFPIDP